LRKFKSLNLSWWVTVFLINITQFEHVRFSWLIDGHIGDM
jgi:hypothetical protein